VSGWIFRAGRLFGVLRLARRGKPDRGPGRQLEERKRFPFNKGGLSKNKTKSPEGEKIPREQALEHQEPEAFERKRALWLVRGFSRSFIRALPEAKLT